jgi:hypothetical protein
VLGLAGVLFLLYPVVRPYADELTMQGAEAYASTAWVAAHLFAMIGFILIPLGLRGVVGERAVVVTWIGAGLTLPYYGAEAFGLHALGLRAISEQNPALLTMADGIRYNPAAIAMFALGLLSLAVGMVMAAVAIRRSGVLSRWSGVPLAVGFALFIPQFFGTPPLRMAHGALLAVGFAWVAVEMWRKSASAV